ncbi:MAG: hypothetical protein JWQ60_5593, partial [Pseudonocardia sp.]|nr:hypothetical protein [Pseudonocardia sp.]
VPNVALTQQSFTMDKANLQLPIENIVTQPNSPYGG